MAQDYYHIQRNISSFPKIEKGTTIETKEVNNFSKKLAQSLEGINEIDTRNINEIVKVDDFFQNISDICECNDIISKSYIKATCAFYSVNADKEQFLKRIQENIFEIIRKQNFPNLPSRRYCFWMSEKKELTKWWDKIVERDFRGGAFPRNILKLKIIEGNTHKTDAILLDSKTESINGIIENSKKYWEGFFEKNEEIEVLFTGKLQVIDTFSDINEIL